ncbi:MULTISPECIES: RNA polymerase sigma factor [Dyadobacter]|jgi:RNA polymerase sigma factor (sigma-70 family)|uniref:Sigma-70 family RNA polymerase sigma factor n=1 Tax=Dyadobacter chenhuakuii TaxID=2909339 RepID=A0A9X1QGD1_9BACT|nr:MULTISPECIES: sigma-70 family RNA polymerase sigma factor [Dyadobacter]MCF2499249.1 sigma-70 family RNA polymerase sigma factor [Dyadobacter chenhuakuii]MCF2517438.1 sigma-70 family RNA polymerase sigma factor [Dyadobacter sp. CY351]
MKFFLSKKFSNLTSLVKACQKQDPGAQTAFYERYKGRLTGVCQRYARTKMEAEDIFQEAFIKIFNNIQDLKDPESVDSWVKVTVVRTAINYYHRTTKQQDLNGSIHNMDIQLESDDYEKIVDQLNVEDLLAIINELPDKYRTIINLHLIDGYTHAEIGELLSIPDATSRSQFMRGRNLLLKKLELKGIVHHENF